MCEIRIVKKFCIEEETIFVTVIGELSLSGSFPMGNTFFFTKLDKRHVERQNG